jgi:hypothetical protein
MFRLPNITGKTDSEKIAQLTDYMFQFVRELNMKFDSLEENTDDKGDKNG